MSVKARARHDDSRPLDPARATPPAAGQRTVEVSPIRDGLRAENGPDAASSSAVTSIPPVVLSNLAALPASDFVAHALRTMRGLVGSGQWFHFSISGDFKAEDGVELHLSSDTVDQAEGPAMKEVLRREIRGRVSEFAAAWLDSQGVKGLRRETRIGPRQATIQLHPVVERGSAVALFAVLGVGERRDHPGLAEGLQLLAVLHHLGRSRGGAERDRRRFSKVAAFVEMLSSVAPGADFPECCQRIGNHLRDLLGCETVALVAPTRFGRQKVVAVSGSGDEARTASSARSALLALACETQRRAQPIEFFQDPGDGLATSESGAVAQVREALDPAFAMATPLTDHQGEARGAWVFLWNEVPDEIDEKRLLLKAAGPEVAAMLSVLRAARPGPFRGALVRFWRRATASQRRFYTSVGVIAAIALCVPIPYPVTALVQTEPVVRRVVAAPFDGILSHSLVRAGERVEAGAVIAELDGREIRASLAAAIARQARAGGEADSHFAAGRIADARMAELEVESLKHEIAVLEHRRDNLQVRSPIAGLVLQGDMERSEGAPLKMGDPLFEVGPLDRLVFELGVDATDIAMVAVGDTASVKLRVAQGGEIDGEISRIAPRSEQRDGRNVFVCEVEVDNPEQALRPGLEGSARVSGPWRPLAWAWLRDGWLALRYHLW